MEYNIDPFAAGIALIFLVVLFLVWRFCKRYALPYLYFSDTQDMSTVKSEGNFRVHIANASKYFGLASLLCFLIAFIDPHYWSEKKEQNLSPDQVKPFPTEGIAIYLLLDHSGSMSEKVSTLSPNGNPVQMPKIDLLKQVTADFITGNAKTGLEGRPNDLIGMITFARTADVLAPLTLDHQILLDTLSKLNIVQDPNYDGTSMGYAIYKTANMIAATEHFSNDLIKKGKPAYDIKSAVILLVTDGFQDPNLLDKGNGLRNMDPLEAAQYAKDKGIRMYVVNVDPSMGTEEYGPQRRLIQKAAALTGGKFFLLGTNQSLSEIYSQINQLEKGFIPEDLKNIARIPKNQNPSHYNRVSFYPWLIALGLTLMAICILLETTILRRIP